VHDVALLPGSGCPGPSVVDVGLTLRLVVLDTEWWLRPSGERAPWQASACATTESAVLSELRAALSAAGTRRVVVAGHHPLASGGPHGGHFGWREHLFPLRDEGSGWWLPLPIIGSIYVLARRNGASAEDLSSEPYRRLRHALETAFVEYPPLAYAAGHEHNLQVFRSKSARHVLVSGGGTYGHPSRVVSLNGTLFARAASGFMRIDVWEHGPALLTVVVVDGGGAATEPFSMLLD
jgi:hypothetical protein